MKDASKMFIKLMSQTENISSRIVKYLKLGDEFKEELEETIQKARLLYNMVIKELIPLSIEANSIIPINYITINPLNADEKHPLYLYNNCKYEGLKDDHICYNLNPTFVNKSILPNLITPINDLLKIIYDEKKKIYDVEIKKYNSNKNKRLYYEKLFKIKQEEIYNKILFKDFKEFIKSISSLNLISYSNLPFNEFTKILEKEYKQYYQKINSEKIIENDFVSDKELQIIYTNTIKYRKIYNKIISSDRYKKVYKKPELPNLWLIPEPKIENEKIYIEHPPELLQFFNFRYLCTVDVIKDYDEQKYTTLMNIMASYEMSKIYLEHIGLLEDLNLKNENEIDNIEVLYKKYYYQTKDYKDICSFIIKKADDNELKEIYEKPISFERLVDIISKDGYRKELSEMSLKQLQSDLKNKIEEIIPNLWNPQGGFSDKFIEYKFKKISSVNVFSSDEYIYLWKKEKNKTFKNVLDYFKSNKDMFPDNKLIATTIIITETNELSSFQRHYKEIPMTYEQFIEKYTANEEGYIKIGYMSEVAQQSESESYAWNIEISNIDTFGFKLIDFIPGLGKKKYELIYDLNNNVYFVKYPNSRKSCLLRSVVNCLNYDQNKRKNLYSHFARYLKSISLQDKYDLLLIKDKYDIVCRYLGINKQLNLIKNTKDITFKDGCINLISRGLHVGSLCRFDHTKIKTKDIIINDSSKPILLKDIHVSVLDLEFLWKVLLSGTVEEAYKLSNILGKNLLFAIADKPCMISTMDHNGNQLFSTLRDWFTYLKNNTNGKPVYIYSHNGSSVEHLFFIKEFFKEMLGNKEYLKLKNINGTNINSFDYENFHFRDTLKYFPNTKLVDLVEMFCSNKCSKCSNCVECNNYNKQFLKPNLLGRQVVREVVKYKPHCDKCKNCNCIESKFTQHPDLVCDSCKNHTCWDCCNKIVRCKKCKNRKCKDCSDKYFYKQSYNNNELDEKYCKMDSKTLYSSIMKANTFINKIFGKDPETWNLHYASLPSLMKNELIKISKFKNSSYMQALLRYSYHGGICNGYDKKKYIGKIFELDINSSYPFQWLKHIPGMFKRSHNSIDKINHKNIWGGLFVISHISSNPDKINLLTHMHDGKLLTPHFKNPTLVWIWDKEYKVIKDKIKIHECKYILEFERTTMYKDIITKLYKTRTIHGKDSAMGQLCKFMMNSSYGSLGLKSLRQSRVLFNDVDKVHKYMNGSVAYSFDSMKEDDKYYCINLYDCQEVTTQLQVASYTTMSGRLQLYLKNKEIESLGYVLLYNDTDSCYYFIPDNLINKFKHTSKLGGWEMLEYNEFQFFSPKCYKAINYNNPDKSKIKEKGVSDRPTWYKSIYGEAITAVIVNKCMSNNYTKGEVLENGSIIPITI